MSATRPWTDPAALANQLAGWRKRWSQRPLFRVTAGQNWVRLGLEGDQRPGILLANLPGANLVLAQHGRLPGSLDKALPSSRKHPLSNLLEGSVFSSCGMFPDDMVAAIRLARPDGSNIYLLHQLFGSRGNTTLVDQKSKLLWSRHRPPHSLLAMAPPATVWATGNADQDTAETSGLALGHLAVTLLGESSQEAAGILGRRLKSAWRLVENLARDFDRAEKGDLYRRYAEALASHLHNVPTGVDSLEVSDPRSGEPLTIAMDPALTPAANMEAWFRKARKADKGRDVIAERLAAARVELTELEEAEAELKDIQTTDVPVADMLALLQDWRVSRVDLFPVKSKQAPSGRHGPEEPSRPFRRYLVDGRWEVWVGRNNKENDELTHRASHVQDIWFHAQGVPGSHVILRTGGKPEQVPKTVLAKAASLAALNSRARHSGLVPVIHTERKYVRKPRKTLAGTAVCLREKSIFVVPGVEPGVVSI